MSEWAVSGTPAIGVHETAVAYSDVIKPRRKRYQHWNGRFWGAIGTTPEQARAYRDEPTQYLPAYWRAIEEEVFA
jgi:hypothetical protein